MHGLRHKRLAGKSHATTGGTSQRSNPSGTTSQRSNAAGTTSQRSNATGTGYHRSNVDGTSSQRSNADGSQMNHGGTDEDMNDGAIISEVPPQRGRGKRNRTQLRVLPGGRKVQLKPKGCRQFTYVDYNPKIDYRYGSQVGVIIKRLYPGGVDIRDEQGRVTETRTAVHWSDYFLKKDERGLTHARLVKHEFWNLFSVHRNDMRKASLNLEAYLRKRVSDMVYQARLDAVKLHEGCNDEEACKILLTKEQYINSKLDWCSSVAWTYLATYWTSKEYLDKRMAAQASRLKSEDVAQNRGGSRPWSETQQLLEYKFGPEKASTLNTYAVMKSGFKNVDNSGKSAPIRSRRAQKRLDDYNAVAKPAENSQELDGKVLYFMEGGLRHGRVPIGDGAVDREGVQAAAKSRNFHATNTDAYQSVVEENEQLKELQGQLKAANVENKRLRETNAIIIDENGVNRDMIMVLCRF